MNAPVRPFDFTNVKCEPLSQLADCEHRIAMRLPSMLGMHRQEELRLLDRFYAESAQPEWYPHQ